MSDDDVERAVQTRGGKPMPLDARVIVHTHANLSMEPEDIARWDEFVGARI